MLTRLTLRTHDLPETFGAVRGVIQASSDAAYLRLVAAFVAFYADRLCNPHWGETATVQRDNTLRVAMAFQGLGRAEAEGAWRQFLAWVGGAPGDFAVAAPFQTIAVPARRLWDADYLRDNLPGAAVFDDRPGASRRSMAWAGDAGQAGQFIHGYDSAWLPQSLLAPAGQATLARALFAASRHWPVALHFNKGLAGAPAEARADAADTPVHPGMLDAFALAISSAEGPPAFPGLPAPDLPQARRRAASVRAAMAELRAAAPGAGSYVSEGDYFDADWQASHWGPNYERLRAIKRRYDPDGLFFAHHGVGSEEWSSDGFTKAEMTRGAASITKRRRPPRLSPRSPEQAWAAVPLPFLPRIVGAIPRSRQWRGAGSALRLYPVRSSARAGRCRVLPSRCPPGRRRSWD